MSYGSVLTTSQIAATKGINECHGQIIKFRDLYYLPINFLFVAATPKKKKILRHLQKRRYVFCLQQKRKEKGDGLILLFRFFLKKNPFCEHIWMGLENLPVQN